MLGYWKHPSETAFLTHWMQARSIGPNCGGSDGFGKGAHLMPGCSGHAGEPSSPEMQCVKFTHPALNLPLNGRRTLTGMSFP
jgi:hypothetical protein